MNLYVLTISLCTKLNRIHQFTTANLAQEIDKTRSITIYLYFF